MDQPREAPPAGNVRVLFVDDEPATREGFRRSMQALGFQVDVARDAREALSKAEAAVYGVVATDWLLPDIQGPQLIRLLKEKNPNASYILLTGARTIGLGDGPAMREAAAVLSKPWSNDEMRTVLETAIAMHLERSGTSAEGTGPQID